MSGFDRRWRRLARASSSAEPPLPPPPDGARLMRLARATPPASARRSLAFTPAGAVAVAALWAASLALAAPAWRVARDAAGRLLAAAPAPACRLSRPALPVWPRPPATVLPRVPSPERPAWLPRIDVPFTTREKETAS